MSWAEFVIRSIGFKKQREHEFNLVKMAAYESFKIPYGFAGKKPPSFERFWKMKDQKSVIPEEFMEMARKARMEYLKKND